MTECFIDVSAESRTFTDISVPILKKSSRLISTIAFEVVNSRDPNSCWTSENIR